MKKLELPFIGLTENSGNANHVENILLFPKSKKLAWCVVSIFTQVEIVRNIVQIIAESPIK